MNISIIMGIIFSVYLFYMGIQDYKYHSVKGYSLIPLILFSIAMYIYFNIPILILGLFLSWSVIITLLSKYTVLNKYIKTVDIIFLSLPVIIFYNLFNAGILAYLFYILSTFIIIFILDKRKIPMLYIMFYSYTTILFIMGIINILY
jgi:hypothetical protein